MKNIRNNAVVALIAVVAVVTVCFAVVKITGIDRYIFSSQQHSDSTSKESEDSSVSSEAITVTTEPTTTAPATTAPITVKQKDEAKQETTQATTSTTKKNKEQDEEEFNFTIIDILPLSLASGSWDVKHCQGMALDAYKGYVYYSYTNTFVKCDLEGNVVGTITGIKGHLGDICYNKDDGKVYASYNPTGKKALYTAIIDVDNLNETGLDAVGCGLIRTVHLKAVYEDYSAKVTFIENEPAENVAEGEAEQKVKEKVYKRRYGVTGTDAVCFGPSFSTGKGSYFTVSCGITPSVERTDNDYQILIQYNVKDWWDTYSQPLSFETYHRNGPEGHNGKYFIYTGSTTYGVQTMTYFRELNLWILNVYTTKKADFVNYNMFIVDGDVEPRKEILRGQPAIDEQYVLSLYQDGEYDKKTGIYGWHVSKGSKGMEYISDGLFYIIHPFRTWYKTQTAVAYLYVWNPSGDEPFKLAAGVGSDYTVPEKKPYVPPPTTLPPTTQPTTQATTAADKQAFNLEDIFSVFR